jgi:hypothetical protein
VGKVLICQRDIVEAEKVDIGEVSSDWRGEIILGIFVGR